MKNLLLAITALSLFCVAANKNELKLLQAQQSKPAISFSSVLLGDWMGCRKAFRRNGRLVLRGCEFYSSVTGKSERLTSRQALIRMRWMQQQMQAAKIAEQVKRPIFTA